MDGHRRAMAQGTIKQSSKVAKAKETHSKKQASKAAKPKKISKAHLDRVHRKFTSGMVGRTEAILGERAGHLELIGKGKKAGKKTGLKGGSRKFG
ncbi:hypothetical protein ACO1O0_002318 [Amphichorda felina]